MASSSGFFYVGGRYVDYGPVTLMVDQLYVAWRRPAGATEQPPIVFVHGGGQTGTNFDGTPDGRQGWAEFFCAAGHEVYVVDQPARGRSPYHPEIHGPLRPIDTKDVEVIERRLTATADYALWPQATLHTQWPGSGRRGDPWFDEFCASQIRMIEDFALVEQLMRAAGRALLERIGPAIVVTHSHGGALGWQMADECPELVAGVVAVEPAGPPFVNVELVGGEDFARVRSVERAYGLTATPLAYDPPVTDPETDLATVSPEARPAFWRLQAEPARRLLNLVDVPVAVVTGEASYHAVFDEATVAYLRQAGVEVDHLKLAERGIRGNGHMMMLERNSLEIAAVIARWIKARGFGHEVGRDSVDILGARL